jgi:hypothetical protein
MSDTQTKVIVRIRNEATAESTLVFWTDFRTDKPIRRIADDQVRKMGGYRIVGLSYSRTLRGVERHI